MDCAQSIRLEDRRNELMTASKDLVQKTLQRIILLTGTIYLLCYYIAIVAELVKLDLGSTSVTAVILLSGGIALWLMARDLLTAQIVWQTGLAVAITLALYISQCPEVVFLYALLPLLAAITISWQIGVVTELLVIGMVVGISWTRWAPPIPIGYRLLTIVGGAYGGLLGWAVIHTLLTVTQWSLFYADRAQKSLKEAYEQRVELKQVQEDLLQANRELARLSERLEVMYRIAEEARRTKEEFVANVSHELRTPLNIIIGFCEVITQTPQVYGERLPPALLADITAIQRNAHHLAKLVDDVLDLSQIEAGRMALSKEWVSPREIVDEAVQVVQPLFKSKGLYLKTDVPSDLPSILCDSTRIRQVVINLLSNAGRFTERGGVQVRVWQEENSVLFSVSDTGPGIPEEAQKKIFEPFQQADGTIRRAYGGSGLGLSISKKFVEMHGGKMQLESEVGVGTTIAFSLPLKVLPAAPLSGAESAKRWFNPYEDIGYRLRIRRSKASVPALVPRFVLLEVGETLRRLFMRYWDNAEIVSVQDIDAAIRELSHSPAQALIVNAAPFEGSSAFLERLRHLPHDTPAIWCWVPGEENTVEQLGVARYLVKPITRETLLEAIGGLGKKVRTILMVDDEPEVLRLFTRMLSTADYKYDILQAKNGQRALDLLREHRPDVVLLDLIMPGIDGFQVLREKRKDPSIRDIPVIVISSRDPSGEPIVSDGMRIVRGKGLSVRDLLACIKAVSEVMSPLSPHAAPAQPGTSAV